MIASATRSQVSVFWDDAGRWGPADLPGCLPFVRFLIAFQVFTLFSKHSGLVAVAPVSGTTAGATIAADEVIDMIGAVTEAYATAPGAGWCMSLATLTAIRKLKNTNNRYYFPAERGADGRQLLAGFRVYLCPSFPAVASGAKVLSFGDHSRFYIRQVVGTGGFWVRKYAERYAEMGQSAVAICSTATGLSLSPPAIIKSPCARR